MQGKYTYIEPITDEKQMNNLKKNQGRLATASRGLNVLRDALYQFIEPWTLMRKTNELTVEFIAEPHGSCEIDAAQMAVNLEVSQRRPGILIPQLGMS